MTVETALANAKEAHKLASQAHQKAEIALVKHDDHEKVCADRYNQIIGIHTATQEDIKDTQKEIKSAKNYLIGVLVTMLISMVGFVATMVIVNA